MITSHVDRQAPAQGMPPATGVVQIFARHGHRTPPRCILHFAYKTLPRILHSTKHELSMPPTIELSHAKGFSPYMLRAILSGRGDEIVELARTNLR